jgi:dihydroorotate dehydrogenase (NAD+) catalytic subunit
MKIDLTTKIKDLTFRNPITVASGTFGTKDEYKKFVPYEKLGAVITKTITVRPRAGNPMPRICETSGGMLNAIGLQNKGLEDFLENKIPYFSKVDTNLIVNIAGETTEDFRELTKALHKHKGIVKALELNLSCPNVEAGGATFMRKRQTILDIMKTVKDETDLFIFAKLSPELGDVVEIAGDVIRAGADGLSLINTLKGMAVDIYRRVPRIANTTGGLSGPAIKPVALRYVYEVKKNFKIPIIASGGIMTPEDALEFLIVGADLLAIGTANFVNPTATLDILEGINQYCKKYNIKHLDDLRGTLKIQSKENCAATAG